METFKKPKSILLILILVFTTLLVCIMPFTFASSVQEAINNASSRQKVIIKKGEYIEQITINKSIHLIGEDPRAVVLNPNGSGYAMKIFGENVLLESFSIKNSGEGFAGIYVKAKNVTIMSCLITNCYIGIKIDSSSNIQIINCTILNNTYAGIWISGACENVEIHDSTIVGSKYAIGLLTFSKRNMLLNNIICNNYIGIALINSKENQIVKNRISNNTYGLWFEDRLSIENIVSKNTLSNNTCGIYINIFNEGSTNNLFYSNNFINNTVQVLFEPPYYSINYWNSSYPLGGNYWSGYTSQDLDSDGFIDEPYVIAKNNVDYHPLASPYRETVIEKTPEKEWFSQIIIAIVVIVAVYGLTYFLFRRRWSEMKTQVEQFTILQTF